MVRESGRLRVGGGVAAARRAVEYRALILESWLGGGWWRGGNPVHASPLAGSPRQIPARPGRQLRRHVIAAGGARGLAAQGPGEGPPDPRPKAEPGDGPIRTFR